MPVAAPGPAVHALELPRGLVESVACILDDAVDQLAILAEMAARADQDRWQNGDPTASLSHAARLRRRSSAASVASLGGSVNNGSKKLKSAHSAGGGGGATSDADHAKTARERHVLQQLLSKSVAELRDGHVTSLVRAVDEERAKRNLLHNTLDREKEATAHLRDLQRQLADEQRTLDRERKDRDTVIQQLREAIQEIQALTASEQKYLKREMRAHESALKQQYAYQEAQLVATKAHLERHLAMEGKVHAGVVDFLTRQRQVLERQIQDWLGRHEEDTEAKAAEIEALKAARAADVDRFEELVAKYEELERQVDEDRARRDREAEERRQQRALERRVRAARKIQLWWRGFHKADRKGTSGSKRSAGKKKGGSASPKKKSAKKK
ncbi:hypothetical protein GGF31_002415 [Allomyces arbusculus]|nr:hypothetical protein GGF31_002415 [Allomyces arbusculus]